MINIAIRVDASHQIGIGHVMRCLTLAGEIRQKNNARIIFISRKASGNPVKKIKKSGFELIELTLGIDKPKSYLKHGHWLRATQESDSKEFQSALKEIGVEYLDLVVVDHYGIDHLWHKAIKDITKEIFVIDDLGDRVLDCDYLLDQTFSCKKDKYFSLVGTTCKQLLGTKYALLRPEFQSIKPIISDEKSILVMFGGTDPDNLTLQALNIISEMNLLESIVVVLNDTAKYSKEVKEYCDLHDSITLHVSPNNIALLMSEASLGIGAAGATSWERCAAGLPTVVVIQAFNQREIAHSLSQEGVISYIESSDIGLDLSLEIRKWLDKLTQDKSIPIRCQNICDGLGSNRVVKEVFND